jgi:hypothetical protein
MTKRIECRTHSAWVVLNKKGEHVATVTAQYPRDGAGRMSVNVRNTTMGAQQRTADRYAATYGKRLIDRDATDAGGLHLWFQAASASGYGYDKTTAALAGLIVDGHTLADHCGRVPEAETAKARLFAAYQKARDAYKAAPSGEFPRRAWEDKARKIGARFANWSQEAGGYTSLHFEPGLDRLRTLGYRVVQAL